MNSNKICINCGSSSFVSDRSLGGKIICARCGSSSFRNKSFVYLKNKNILFIIIGIVVFLIII